MILGLRYSNDTFMKILPAMCDRRACIWCIHRNNSSKELKEWSWMFGYAMIGPSCILKLFYLSTIRVSHLFLLKKMQNNSKLWLKYVDICWAMYSQRHMSIVVAHHAIHENTHWHETSKLCIYLIFINT